MSTNKIENFTEAKHKLEWIKSIYEIFGEEEIFFFELALTLEIKSKPFHYIFKSEELIINSPNMDDKVNVIYQDENSDRRQVSIRFEDIQMGVNSMKQSLLTSLKERRN